MFSVARRSGQPSLAFLLCKYCFLFPVSRFRFSVSNHLICYSTVDGEMEAAAEAEAPDGWLLSHVLRCTKVEASHARAGGAIGLNSTPRTEYIQLD
ncbi:hypothetical protein DM02DRAFT_133957 [Periconia macrospinosa]|uniref:Uncharacterized protein n=1 Tax=Periconia macrospinosa TaxID=97972 RepID=A0A2V1E315_9PLEO|nr:hypothetical protein DM02DRAFT_133957 [Periconia macrospinosa]